jgi:putative SOS response-associated peptidase YedK
MRWVLVPYWWNMTLKESMKLASFNARAEAVATKPFFREPFMPVSGYYEWQDTPGGK